MQFEVSVALNFIISYLYNKLPRRRVNMFGEQMPEYLHIKYRDHWYPERPTKGSAYRSIRISKEKVDKILINAAIDVGLDLREILDSLPNDLMIWIDPGEVSYRIGEKGLVTILYRNENCSIRYSESSSDSEEVSHHDSSSQITSDFSSWTNAISAQAFAQTKFGSLKIKNTRERNQTKILYDEFSAYIKQKEQLKIV